MSEATPPPAKPTPNPTPAKPASPPQRRAAETTTLMPQGVAPDKLPRDAASAPGPIGSSDYPTILDGVNAGDVVWVLNYLYAHPDEANHSSPENGWMPLHVAAMNGHYRMTEILLRFGAEVDTPNKAGKNPLHDAARKGFADVVQLLLDYGADPSIPYKEETAVQRAANNGHGEVAALIEAHVKEHAN